MTQLTFSRRLPVLPLAVAGSHAALELLHQILPVVYPLLIAERGFTYAQIGTLALVAGLGGTVAQPLFGWLSDRWDARWLALLSLGWMGGAMALVGWVQAFGWLMLVIGLATLASAAYHPAGATLARVVGRSQPGLTMSLFSTGGAAGSALSPLLIGGLLVTFGLRGTLFWLPLGLLLAGGLLFPLRHIILEPARSAAIGQSQAGSVVPIILLVIVCGARSWLQGALGTYLPEWLISQGSSLEQASGAFAIFLLAISGGGLMSGLLADRFGNWRVMTVALLLLSPLYWLFLMGTPILAFPALILLGVALGFTYPISILMAQQAWPQAVGMASALVIGIGWLPAGLGAWAVGQIADSQSLAAGLNSLVWVPLISVGVMLVYRRWSNE